MKLIPFRYILAFLPAVATWISFHSTGLMAWTAVWFVFGMIPILELCLGHGGRFGADDNQHSAVGNSIYSIILYLVIPVQIFFVYQFAFHAIPESKTLSDSMGRTVSMGILCGSFGINVAHELGHRTNKWSQFFAKILLLTSLYMHFFIEHNRGHHKYVATPEDPSTARKNESVFVFIIRSMIFVWISAFQLEKQRLKREGKSVLSIHNQWLRFQFYQLIYLVGFWYFTGFYTTFLVWLSAFIGGILLETINYIEHYGLLRNKLENGMYELVTAKHSWNSNHIVGRLLLFELSRHSDHHANTVKKYQELRTLENAPQMPTGYPGMMVLSFIAPLFIRIMNSRIPD